MIRRIQPEDMATQVLSVWKHPSFPMLNGNQEGLLNNRFTMNLRELRYRGGPKIYSIVFIEERMVGVTGIEPVTPTMST